MRNPFQLKIAWWTLSTSFSFAEIDIFWTSLFFFWRKFRFAVWTIVDDWNVWRIRNWPTAHWRGSKCTYNKNIRVKTSISDTTSILCFFWFFLFVLFFFLLSETIKKNTLFVVGTFFFVFSKFYRSVFLRNNSPIKKNWNQKKGGSILQIRKKYQT